MADNLGLVLLVGFGAYYLMKHGGFGGGGPVYRNMSGQAITEITCGQSITFDVPGYSRVWIDQLKDGQLAFNGPYDVPMPPYILNCASETGVYDVAAYVLDPGDIKGELIGQTRFTVHPQA